MEQNLYFDILPSELIELIIEHVDNCRGEEHLTNVLKNFLSLSNNYIKCYNKYIENIYGGYINLFKCYTFDNYKPFLKQGHMMMLDYAKKFINNKLTELNYSTIDNVLIYHIASMKNMIKLGTYHSKSDETLYIICKIDNKFCYIKYFLDYEHDMYETSDPIMKMIVTLKEYNCWKDLYDNLCRDHIIKMYQHNKYELPEDKFKSYRKNKY